MRRKSGRGLSVVLRLLLLVPYGPWGFRVGVPVFGILISMACVARPRAFQPRIDPETLDDTEFLHYLPTAPVVTVDEGMRAVLLLRGPTSDWPTHQDRYDELARIGALRSRWHLKSDHILDKGTLAYMVRTICDLPSSAAEWFSRPTGLGDRRYALKTCIFEEIMPYATADQQVTGGELLSVLTNAEGRVASEP